MTYHDLPEEILYHVLHFLEAQELAQLAPVSKYWKQLSESNRIWQLLYLRDFGGNLADCESEPVKSWKYLYEERRTLNYFQPLRNASTFYSGTRVAPDRDSKDVGESAVVQLGYSSLPMTGHPTFLRWYFRITAVYLDQQTLPRSPVLGIHLVFTNRNRNPNWKLPHFDWWKDTGQHLSSSVVESLYCIGHTFRGRLNNEVIEVQVRRNKRKDISSKTNEEFLSISMFLRDKMVCEEHYESEKQLDPASMRGYLLCSFPAGKTNSLFFTLDVVNSPHREDYRLGLAEKVQAKLVGIREGSLAFNI